MLCSLPSIRNTNRAGAASTRPPFARICTGNSSEPASYCERNIRRDSTRCYRQSVAPRCRAPRELEPEVRQAHAPDGPVAWQATTGRAPLAHRARRSLSATDQKPEQNQGAWSRSRKKVSAPNGTAACQRRSYGASGQGYEVGILAAAGRRIQLGRGAAVRSSWGERARTATRGRPGGRLRQRRRTQLKSSGASVWFLLPQRQSAWGDYAASRTSTSGSSTPRNNSAWASFRGLVSRR